MTHTVKLKRRYPPDGNRSHWVWVLRYWSADACKEIGEVIGWYAAARDAWRPRWCKGPRLTESQAKEKQVRRRNDLRERRVGQPEPTHEERGIDSASVSLDQWIEVYVKETRGTVRETTLREIHDALLSLDRAASPATATAVNHRTVKQFIQARGRDGIQRSTIWKQISALRRVWYDAHIDPNPWAQPKLRRQLKSAPKDWHWYSTEQFGRLMAKCDEWRTREEDAKRSGWKWVAFKGMVAVAYTGGLRLGEISNLTWADVDADAAEILIAPKTRSASTLPWEPKDHELRVVPLAAVVGGILERLRETVEDGNPYVFVSANRHALIMNLASAANWREGKRLINNVRRDFRVLCEAAKVPICAFHSLRKSCCTNLLEGGVAPHAVQKIIGHASLETTIKYYSKVRRDQIAVAREVADRYTADRGSCAPAKAKTA